MVSHDYDRLVIGQCSTGVILFFFNDTATTEIYTLSLHDALPISRCSGVRLRRPSCPVVRRPWPDRKSTRLNSSHTVISYAVFCLKKKTFSFLSFGVACSRPPKPRISSGIVSRFYF